jgi:hypothetical protein
MNTYITLLVGRPFTLNPRHPFRDLDYYPDTAIWPLHRSNLFLVANDHSDGPVQAWNKKRA